jgi:Sec-independent protein translocase protein TatA
MGKLADLVTIIIVIALLIYGASKVGINTMDIWNAIKTFLSSSV